MSIGEKIKKCRKQKGLTQLEMSEILGITKSVFSKYEKDYVEPNLKNFATICKTLNLSADELLELK